MFTENHFSTICLVELNMFNGLTALDPGCTHLCDRISDEILILNIRVSIEKAISESSFIFCCVKFCQFDVIDTKTYHFVLIAIPYHGLS